MNREDKLELALIASVVLATVSGGLLILWSLWGIVTLPSLLIGVAGLTAGLVSGFAAYDTLLHEEWRGGRDEP